MTKLLATGTLQSFIHKADDQIDLQGAAMYPGFVDSHLHMIFQGEKLIRLDLTKATSAEEMLEMVKEAAKTDTSLIQWLFGEGWNENNFADGRIPTIRKSLMLFVKEPILLTRICHHVILGNTAALEAGGISQNRESPAGGEIGRDATGKLNGLLYDQAMNSCN